MNPSITPIAGLIGLAVALIILRQILKQPSGEGKIRHIAQQIHRGAMIFMRREFTLISLFAIVIGCLLFFFQKEAYGKQQALAFFLGCLASSFAGFVGMFTATKANVRTTIAARHHGQSKALTVAFGGGSVMGLTVASMGLIGLGGLFYVFQSSPHVAEIMEGFAMGASLVALFYRVGGGIFTKAADVGADLVGKVEAGIPEDDPRNPGVIADNVGDNVGDVAGMGSDIFESYCGAQIATIAIAGAIAARASEQTELLEKIGLSASNQAELAVKANELMYLPLALTTIGLFCSILGIVLVKATASKNPASALRFGTIGSAILFILATFALVHQWGLSPRMGMAVLSGAVGGIIIGLITEYFTGGKPVRDIARSGETGVATVMITGLSVGMKSVAIPVITLAGIIFISFEFAGLYGVGLAAVGMLGTVGITMAIDAYGPVADNAGGIAEMAKLGPNTRKITDGLDAVGNTTAAIGKGFAIGAAGLAALAMITAFIQKSGVGHDFDFSDDSVLRTFFVGLFIGGVVPFVNGAITMDAVGDAAYDMIREIRRQFREIPGLMDGEAEPDSEKCVEIATRAAMQRMILPALLAVGTPVLVGFGFKFWGVGAIALTGTLCGALLTCILLALFMSNAGGAWDNAKKYVEDGHCGGKNSETHKGCVVGDTVGDPFKDTSGPSMNILINVMSIVSLVIAPLL
ncbi:sodium-translocating pyrophosphatase [Verrucomicrobiaceae bacterium N1E253]|uniref:Putative K(+)-stimulated pyrophosphate-energized sodium pump n=1 Tax=Oceaniferula marina TaxID=2748318 RepID=A0A851GL21_9BACT|nr:sodium-translocating pyrophosphatase [Oceaniferula marina]NWK55430.1 sodium-translocating pyrophosphatase [Oceaniferula marina]